MATYLPTVERPRGSGIKLVDAFARRMFGKVPTSTRVFTPSMPPPFISFYGRANRLDRKLRLEPATALVIRQQVARINGCTACTDAGRWYALRGSPANTARFDALWEYRTSPLFDSGERAALDYATELTVDKEVAPGTFARLVRYYSEREIFDIVWLVASEHLANITDIGLKIEPGRPCDLGARPSAGGPTCSRPARDHGHPSAAVGPLTLRSS
jgi:alkylhydroperoxidase family enzyme